MECVAELAMVFQVFFTKWYKSRTDCLAEIVIGIIQTRTVNLAIVAESFSGNSKIDSNYKRIIWVLKKENKKLLLYWNYLGILVLASVIFVFVSTLYLPQIYGFDKTPMKVSFLEYPFILVAAFMMPLAVFLHILSIIRINKNPKFN